MICLTSIENKPVWVNHEYITAFEQDDEGDTAIGLITGNAIYVKETPKQILEKLGCL